MRARNERGAALMTTMIVMTMMSAILLGFTALVMTDQRARFHDRDRTNAFYAAHSGLEKLTNDLGALFGTNFAPTDAEVNALATSPPVLTGVQFVVPGGGSGYTITRTATQQRTLTTGQWAGLTGLVTPYTMNVTARTSSGAETSLTRTLNTVSIPVFQFGIFSETDLSFFPGPDFNFGGRVHTNGNLFLAKDDNGNELVLADRVSAYGDIIRQDMQNGRDTVSADYDGVVRVLRQSNGCAVTTASTCRPIALTEGSLVDGPGTSPNTNWQNVSTGTYNAMIRNGAWGAARGTGATRLNLPITDAGATPIDLIRRPAANETTANPNLFSQRYFSIASLRILISDTAGDLTSLPTITGGAPIDLSTLAATTARSPIGRSGSGGNYLTSANQPLVKGFIKIERQSQAGGAWTDVTQQIVDLGIAGRNLSTASCVSGADVNPNAVLRFERVKDSPTTLSPCGLNTSTGAFTNTTTDYWPNALYDTREGNFRDASPGTSVYLGGVIHYVELDIRNLRNWLSTQRNAGSLMTTTGYVVYFSDRRGNHNGPGGAETGEYGFEDFVNPSVSNGLPNSALDTGEDMNGDGVQQVYGNTPATITLTGIGSIAPMNASARPQTLVTEGQARSNNQVLFRRALKLVNGNRTNMRWETNGQTPLGLTIVSENPVYVQGDYNATTSEGVPNTYTQPHVAAAIIADAVTLLSGQWNDRTSFTSPHDPGGRAATTATYRVAIISGKGRAFPWITGTSDDYGTDGGTHNFLRYLESWSGTLNYRGSIVSLYYSRQGVGTYKCCTTVYGPPTRAYVFDNEFLQPLLLPPRTPMFRDINTTGFTRLPAPPSP
jgi:PilX N-terminal